MIDIQKLKQFPLAFKAFEKYIEKELGSVLFIYNGSNTVRNEDAISFLDDYYIHISTDIEIIGSDEWEFSYKITWLPIEHDNEKRRCGWLKTKYSYIDGGSSYSGAWDTRNEATNESLLKAFELLENKLKTN